MQKLYFFLIIVLFVGVLVSCNNTKSNKETQSVSSNIEENYDSLQGKSSVYTNYNLPLSVEIYKFLKSKKVEFNKEYLLKIDNQEKNFTEEKRALVLGAYSSDLVHATIFEQNQESIEYFGVSIELAHKIDIDEGYNTKLLDKAYKNLENTDTLNYIAGEAYWKTCMSLEKSNRTNILPLVILGSWVESVHILAKSSLGSPQESGLFIELYQQKEPLANLILYFNEVISSGEQSSSFDELKKWIKKLELIQVKYNEIQFVDKNDLGLEQLKNIIFQIEDLRTVIVE